MEYTLKESPMFETQTLEVNLGPQHPSTHRVFRMKVTLDGETIVKLKPVMGYLHRNHEKLAEDISTKSVAGNLSSQKEFGYLLYNSDGTVGLQLDMRFNKYSSVWKIESL